MAITPTGYPAWVKASAHTTYGGHINKTNYQSQGTINPRTDLSAADYCRMVADLAAVMRTAPFAIMVFTCNDTAPGAPTVDSYTAMSGTEPTMARLGNGSAQFTWDSSYSDEYSVSGDLHIIGVTASVLSTNAEFAVAYLSDPDANGKNERIRIDTYDDAGAVLIDPQVAVVVYTGPV